MSTLCNVEGFHHGEIRQTFLCLGDVKFKRGKTEDLSDLRNYLESRHDTNSSKFALLPHSQVSFLTDCFPLSSSSSYIYMKHIRLMELHQTPYERSALSSLSVFSQVVRVTVN